MDLAHSGLAAPPNPKNNQPQLSGMLKFPKVENSFQDQWTWGEGGKVIAHSVIKADLVLRELALEAEYKVESAKMRWTERRLRWGRGRVSGLEYAPSAWSTEPAWAQRGLDTRSVKALRIFPLI
jgi:hypothetical protein